ncbi:hypothetical protein ACH5RR_032207 [Cinchona calisaya]|uniref:Aminotransferase-like plant mobile domain-containing protein n=1 Tax=Cinchona calisaya TaxID=153742 RepID=A0ABD2YHF4_9GENT
MLGNYTTILEQAGIYGAIAVAHYPYNICTDVLRAFLELWSPLTNTLHFAGGETGISLLDINMICGLPIAASSWVVRGAFFSFYRRRTRRLFHINTYARFFIPSRDRIGDRIWWYCRWWSRSSQPYLGFPINKGAVKLANCGNTTNPNCSNFVDAQKGSNLSNATFFQDGKQVKIKVRRLSSSRSDEKNFKQTHRYKGLSSKSSPETEYTTFFTDLTDQTAGPSVVNEPASKVLSPVPIDPKLSAKEEVSLIDVSKKMVTNLWTKVEKFSRDFIIDSFYAIVKLMTSSDLNELLRSRESVSKHLMRLNGVVLDGDARQTATVLLKEKARIDAKMLENRCGVLTSRIAGLEKSFEQGEKDGQLIRKEIHEFGQEKIRALEDLKKQFQAVFASLDSFIQADW